MAGSSLPPPGAEPSAPAEPVREVPTVPASAGALLFDGHGRLLILRPTYKSGWTLPGGEMEDDGETPWQACRREVLEECGITVDDGRLVCVDFRSPGPRRRGGVRFLFDCGVIDDAVLAGIAVQASEIAEFRLADVPQALALLRGPIRRRVARALAARGFVYLEDGRPPHHPG
jgi:8-oxo-dGTP pyrophosphatase MutT (NUDIX family)